MRRSVRQDAFEEIAPDDQLVGVEGICVPRRDLGVGRLGELGPHVGERCEAEQMQIVGRRRARIVGVRKAVLHQPHGRVLQLVLGVLQAGHEGGEAFVRCVLAHKGVDLGEEAHHRPAALGRELAADEVQRLHAVGALIDQADAHIAQVLRGGEVLGEARTAVHLHGVGADLKALVRQEGFHHGGQKAHVVRRPFALGGIL